MLKEATIISDLITAQPESVRLLLKHYGIDKKILDEETLLLAAKAFGEPFLFQLYSIYSSNSSYDPAGSLTPTTPEAILAASEQKQNGWDKFKTFFQNATDVITGGAIIANKVNEKVNPSTTKEADADLAAKNQQQTFIVFIVIVIVIIVLFLFSSKK